MTQTVVVRTPETTAVTTREVVRTTVVTRGIPGPRGPAGDETVVRVGATPLSGHTAVALDGAGQLVYADCTVAAQLGTTLGVLANAHAAGETALVQMNYDLAHAGWAFTPGPVYVGAGGALVQTLPLGAAFVQVIGYATAADRIRVSIQPPVLIS